MRGCRVVLSCQTKQRTCDRGETRSSWIFILSSRSTTKHSFMVELFNRVIFTRCQPELEHWCYLNEIELKIHRETSTLPTWLIDCWNCRRDFRHWNLDIHSWCLKSTQRRMNERDSHTHTRVLLEKKITFQSEEARHARGKTEINSLVDASLTISVDVEICCSTFGAGVGSTAGGMTTPSNRAPWGLAARFTGWSFDETCLTSSSELRAAAAAVELDQIWSDSIDPPNPERSSEWSRDLSSLCPPCLSLGMVMCCSSRSAWDDRWWILIVQRARRIDAYPLRLCENRYWSAVYLFWSRSISIDVALWLRHWSCRWFSICPSLIDVISLNGYMSIAIIVLTSIHARICFIARQALSSIWISA